MALIPTRQIPLDSFQSSFSKFQGSHLPFFRYNSSIPLKSQSFYGNSSKSFYGNYSNASRRRKSNTFATDSRNLCSSNAWFYKWNKPNNENRPKPPQAVLNYRADGNYSGNGSGSTMEKIVEKLKRHGYVEGGGGDENKERMQERVIEKGSVEDILYVEEGTLPNARGGVSKESPLGMETVFGSDGEVSFPWEKKKKDDNLEDGELEKWTARKKSRTTLAELTLPESELRRLKMLSWQIKTKTKIGGRGVNQEVVDAIHEKWRTSEIVRVKVQGAPALNMKRMHEILEKRTGGLVIWRSGSSLSLYRGVSYEDPSIQQNKKVLRRNAIPATALPAGMGKTAKGSSSGEVHSPQIYTDPTVNTGEEGQRERTMEVKYEDEVDKFLDDLGPRYTDWPGPDPLPVDADMLPGIVPGYQSPYRILPYGVRPSISTKEATSLRRLARTLPPHFALGRSRQLQGLAVAMVKLWEKSSIAKIALKRGVQLTTSERMAEDIKKLTGGMLLSRNKDFLVFYRGKNFLSSDLTEVLLERERLAKSLQDEEEQARLRASVFVVPNVETMEQSRSAGTLEETLNADARWGKRLDDRHKEKIMREANIARHAVIVRKLERKLGLAERKLMKAERDLFKVEEFLKPTDRQADPESITDEERFMFRKLGLRMKAFLLLGRRGVFDGTVENMHLHWKYRELVKIILKAPNFEEVKKIALSLEAESGGVLVSVDKVSKGYAIVVYRGKDYRRPSKLRPGNLLTKRKALARSIEIQRHEALLKHVSALQDKVELIRSQIDQMDTAKDQGDEELYDRLDSAYPTEDDDDTEEEGDEAYLEMYNSENDDDEPDIAVHNSLQETNFPYNAQKQKPDTEFKEDGNKLYAEICNREEQEQDEEDDEEEGADDYDSESDVLLQVH